nr:MAG TPA: hypothetical protein [Bacteriophage sp.]
MHLKQGHSVHPFQLSRLLKIVTSALTKVRVGSTPCFCRWVHHHTGLVSGRFLERGFVTVGTLWCPTVTRTGCPPSLLLSMRLWLLPRRGLNNGEHVLCLHLNRRTVRPVLCLVFVSNEFAKNNYFHALREGGVCGFCFCIPHGASEEDLVSGLPLVLPHFFSVTVSNTKSYDRSVCVSKTQFGVCDQSAPKKLEGDHSATSFLISSHFSLARSVSSVLLGSSGFV